MLKEKKAFKVTTTVLFTKMIAYLPMFVIRELIKNSVIRSMNVTGPVFFTGSFVVIVNSLVNPIIYCVRARQFRVAFIQILLGKTNVQAAEEFEKRIFGSKINNKNNSNNIGNSDNTNPTSNNNNQNSNERGTRTVITTIATATTVVNNI